MQSWQFIILLILCILLAFLLLIVLLRQGDLHRGIKNIDLSDELAHIGGQIEAGTRANAEHNTRLREEVTGSLHEGMRTQSEQLLQVSKLETEALTQMKDTMVETLNSSIDRLSKANEARLSEIQGIVDKKLDKTLNERLDTNFKMVGDQLGRLYQSLGELHSLSGGVADLNKTLSNVKTRGVWGEAQLGHILEQTMSRAQYDTNVQVKKNSDERVEFAILFPAQEEGGDSIYLPIDAKFPSDLYNHLADATETGDLKEIRDAEKALKDRVLFEARKIRDKYINPPRTTNYAIMFLPTEGLYAEVLRVDGLSEECQRMGVVLAGPTTITAILNSLQVGFRNIMLSKKSMEVMKLLEAIKAQFGKLNAAVNDTQKKLSEAISSTEKLQYRAGIIEKRMKKIGEMDRHEAARLLPMDGETDEGSESEDGRVD